MSSLKIMQHFHYFSSFSKMLIFGHAGYSFGRQHRVYARGPIETVATLSENLAQVRDRHPIDLGDFLLDFRNCVGHLFWVEHGFENISIHIFSTSPHIQDLNGIVK